jgi:hypothetical protein
VLNDKGRQLARNVDARGHGYDSATIWHLPVKYLEKGEFRPFTGTAINDGLHSFIEQTDTVEAIKRQNNK